VQRATGKLQGMACHSRGVIADVLKCNRSEWRSRSYSKSIPPSENWSQRIHESKDEIALRKRTLSPVGLVLEDSSTKRSFMLLAVAVVSL
jgi:hypothetical protein